MAWVERLPSGRYRGVYRKGSRKQRVEGSFVSKRRAMLRASEAEALARLSGPSVDQADMTFGEYFEEHWLPNKIAELRTVADYRSTYRAHLGPAFADVQLRDISPAVVQRWLVEMVTSGARPSTIEKRFTTLQVILAGRRGVSALRDGLIDRNPCQGVTRPARPRRLVEVYTVREADLLEMHARAWWRPLIAVAADLGWRWGELVALEVRDLNPGFDTVTLRRVLVEISKRDSGLPERFSVKGYPKENRPRRARLSPEASAKVQALVVARGLKQTDRIFAMPPAQVPEAGDVTDGPPLRTEAWPGGQPVSRAHFRAQVWLPAHARSGVDPVRPFHALRASLISWMLAGGADITSVMDRVGHSHVSTTQFYVNALGDVDDRALQALDMARSRDRARPPTA